MKGKNMASVIRRAEEKDMEGINRLLLEVLLVHHAGRPDLFKGAGKKYTDEQLLAIIRDDLNPERFHVFPEGCEMSIEKVRGYFQSVGIADRILEFDVSSATVELAAQALGVNSCWLNCFDPDNAAKVFGLPENERVLMLLDLGYAAEGAGPLANHGKRKPLSETVKEL